MAYEMGNGVLQKAVGDLLKNVGLVGNWDMEPLSGGGNNRAYLIRIGKLKLFLKHYFTHASEQRNRLLAEYSFADFAWRHGIRYLPRPVGCLPQMQLGLFEFIEGVRLNQSEITKQEIGQAIDFIRELNQFREDKEAAQLMNAAEACFSLKEHCDCIEKRLIRLGNIKVDSFIDQKLVEFVTSILKPICLMIKEDLVAKAGEKGIDVYTPIADTEKCLSPSDFGFHNALRRPKGAIRFFDFEYAGWDDPAKLICDFFCQVKVPVGMNFYPWFRDQIVAETIYPEKLKWRVELLLPVYRLKWCCIVLNQFLPVDEERRKFAQSIQPGGNDLKESQLQKAYDLVQAIQREFKYVI